MRSERLDRIVEGLRESTKYRDVCGATLERIAAWACVRHSEPRAALKAAKRKLHQAYGAYVEGIDFDRLDRQIGALPPPESDADLRLACAQIMRLHASTRERLAILDSVYAALWREIGPVRSVTDLACGLAPFGLPWMGLPAETHYAACDIHVRMIRSVNAFLGRIGRPAAAECRDVLVAPPDTSADVCLLWKTLPCLERQEAGAGLRLLERLPCAWAVVSFPVRSLGGVAKGMPGQYDGYLEGLAATLRAPFRRIAFPDEVFYLVHLARRGA